MSTQENNRLDEAFIAAWNAHDPDRALAVPADDAMWQEAARSKPMRGKAAIRPYLQGRFTAFPDLKATVKSRVVTEDQVAARVGFTETTGGPLQAAPGARQPPFVRPWYRQLRGQARIGASQAAFKNGPVGFYTLCTSTRRLQ